MSVVVLDQQMIKSAVYGSLRGTSVRVFLLFRTKCRIKKIRLKNSRRAGTELIILNNGKIVFTFAEAEKLDPPIPRGTFSRALDELITKGFLDLVHVGGSAPRGDPNLYGLSDRWKKFGQIDFEVVTRQPDRRAGRGFSRVWQTRQDQSRVSPVVQKPAVPLSQMVQKKNESECSVPFVVLEEEVKNLSNSLISKHKSLKNPQNADLYHSWYCSIESHALRDSRRATRSTLNYLRCS